MRPAALRLALSASLVAVLGVGIASASASTGAPADDDAPRTFQPYSPSPSASPTSSASPQATASASPSATPTATTSPSPKVSPEASPKASPTTKPTTKPADKAALIRAKALKVASSEVGKPYRRGAAGPNAFDCSGLVLYSFKAAGKSLPHNAKAQYRATKHIAFKDIKPGDLLFTSGSGNSANPDKISHVGIYAGNGYWYVARKTGQPVAKQRLWASKHLASRP